jgi:hypothetical protein
MVEQVAMLPHVVQQREVMVEQILEVEGEALATQVLE